MIFRSAVQRWTSWSEEKEKIDGSEQIRREDAVKLRALKKLLGVCRSASAVKMSAG